MLSPEQERAKLVRICSLVEQTVVPNRETNAEAAWSAIGEVYITLTQDLEDACFREGFIHSLPSFRGLATRAWEEGIRCELAEPPSESVVRMMRGYARQAAMAAGIKASEYEQQSPRETDGK